MDSREQWEVLQGFKNGHSQAVAVIVDEYYPALLNFLLRMGCSRSDTDDIIQETFIKAAKGLDKHKQPENFRSWLFKISQNTLRDHFKKASKRRELPEDPGKIPRQTEDKSPEDLLIEKDEAQELQWAIKGLPEKQRLCVVLRYYHDFSIEEIARIARCPAGTVKSRLHVAMQNLKKIMEEGKD